MEVKMNRRSKFNRALPQTLEDEANILRVASIAPMIINKTMFHQISEL